jgi:hypothetical protein
MPSSDEAIGQPAGQSGPATGQPLAATDASLPTEHGTVPSNDAAKVVSPDDVTTPEDASGTLPPHDAPDVNPGVVVSSTVVVATGPTATPTNGSGVTPPGPTGVPASAPLVPEPAGAPATMLAPTRHPTINLTFGVEEGHSASAERAPRVYMQTLADEYVKSAAAGDAEAWSDLLTRFADDDHSEIVNTYFCRSIAAGVILTFKESETALHRAPGLRYDPPSYVLHLSYPVVGASPWITELLLELNRQHLEVRQLVPAQAQQLCMEIIFSIASLLLRQLEAAATTTRSPSTTPTSEAAVTQRLYTAEVARSRTFFQSIIQRQYQGSYFRGMVVGIAVIAILGGFGLWMNATWRPTSVTDQAPVLISLIAGAIGALVSVMQRVTSGNLNLLPNAQTSSLWLVGSFRPVLGGLIAVVVFALLASGLLPIKSPGTGTGAEIYFFIAMAFFSGFSERFAQDTLAVGQAGLSGRTSEPPAPAPAARG